MRSLDALVLFTRKLRERLAHNEDYLSRTISARVLASQLTYDRRKCPDWIEGEGAAIAAENEWIRALLKDLT